MYQEGPLSFNGTSSNLVHVQVTPMVLYIIELYSLLQDMHSTYIHSVVVSFLLYSTATVAVQLKITCIMITLRQLCK